MCVCTKWNENWILVSWEGVYSANADDGKEKFQFGSGAVKEINEMWFNTRVQCTNRLDQSNKWPFALIAKFDRLRLRLRLWWWMAYVIDKIHIRYIYATVAKSFICTSSKPLNRKQEDSIYERWKIWATKQACNCQAFVPIPPGQSTIALLFYIIKCDTLSHQTDDKSEKPMKMTTHLMNASFARAWNILIPKYLMRK